MSRFGKRLYGSDMPTSLTYIILVPEAVHLGDLMRIWVRTATKITTALKSNFLRNSKMRLNMDCMATHFTSRIFYSIIRSYGSTKSRKINVTSQLRR